MNCSILLPQKYAIFCPVNAYNLTFCPARVRKDRSKRSMQIFQSCSSVITYFFQFHTHSALRSQVPDLCVLYVNNFLQLSQQAMEFTVYCHIKKEKH